MAVKDIEEIYETKIKQHALHVVRQAVEDGNADSTPFYQGVRLHLQLSEAKLILYRRKRPW